MANEAEKQFEAHDWANDEAWNNKLKNIDFTDSDESGAILKLKRKFFQKSIVSLLLSYFPNSSFLSK